MPQPHTRWRACGRPTLKPRLGGRAWGRWARGEVRGCRALARAVRWRAWARAERCSGHGHPQRSRHGIGFHTRFRGIDRYGKHHRAAVLWLGRGQGRRGEAWEGGEGGRVQLACLGIGCRNDPLTSSRNLPQRNAASSAQSLVLRDAACIGAIESVLKSLGEYVYPQWIR